MSANSKAYLVGGGIGSLAAAAFMIRDGKLPGGNISILEASPVLGGSLDGSGGPAGGYSMRGGRMVTTDNYECTWDLYKTIPSLNHASQTVFDETVEFNEKHQANSMARLVDRRRGKVPVASMGFSIEDRVELLKLSRADEKTLAASRITDWLSPALFETEFWYMWSTTFAFQPWHSAVARKSCRNSAATCDSIRRPSNPPTVFRAGCPISPACSCPACAAIGPCRCLADRGISRVSASSSKSRTMSSLPWNIRYGPPRWLSTSCSVSAARSRP